MALYSVHELFLGIVNAVGLLHGREYLFLDLAAEISGVPVALLYRHVDADGEELFVRNELAVIKILLHAVHRGTAFLTYESGNEIVSAFKRTLKYALGIRAGAIRHIIGRKVRISTSRSAQSYAEAALNIEQRLWYVRTVVGKCKLALGTRLLYKRVVRLLKETFKIDQMLQVSHYVPPFHMTATNMHTQPRCYYFITHNVKLQFICTFSPYRIISMLFFVHFNNSICKMH